MQSGDSSKSQSPYVSLTAASELLYSNNLLSSSSIPTSITLESVKGRGTQQLQFEIPSPLLLHTTATKPSSSCLNRDSCSPQVCVRCGDNEDSMNASPEGSDSYFGTESVIPSSAMEKAQAIFLKDFFPSPLVKISADSVSSAHLVPDNVVKLEEKTNAAPFATTAVEKLLSRRHKRVNASSTVLRLGMLQALLLLQDPPLGSSPLALFTLESCRPSMVSFSVRPTGFPEEVSSRYFELHTSGAAKGTRKRLRKGIVPPEQPQRRAPTGSESSIEVTCHLSLSGIDKANDPAGSIHLLFTNCILLEHFADNSVPSRPSIPDLIRASSPVVPFSLCIEFVSRLPLKDSKDATDSGINDPSAPEEVKALEVRKRLVEQCERALSPPFLVKEARSASLSILSFVAHLTWSQYISGTILKTLGDSASIIHLITDPRRCSSMLKFVSAIVVGKRNERTLSNEMNGSERSVEHQEESILREQRKALLILESLSEGLFVLFVTSCSEKLQWIYGVQETRENLTGTLKVKEHAEGSLDDYIKILDAKLKR